MADNKDKKILNVPALRFPEFSDEWEKCLISDFGMVITGNTPPTKDVDNYKDGIKLWASPIDLGKSKWIYDTQTKLSVTGFEKTRKLPQGAILVTCIGSTIGKMGMATCEMATNQQINSIITNSDNDKDFVYYAIESKFPKYLTSVAIQAVPIISKSSFERLPNIRTTLTEQKKIGRFLSLIDKRIETQNKIIEKYESLIQAMCDTLIERETQQVALSFSDFGQSYSGLSGKNAEDFGDGYPFITYMNVYQNQIIDSTDVGLVKIKETEQQSIVRYGDILFTLSSETPEEVGMGAVYLGETYPLYLNSFCFGIHITDESKIYPPFLAYYVSSQSFRKAVYPLAQGSTRFNLQKSVFMKKKFFFPMIEKQRKIYSILNTYSDKLIVEKQIIGLLCSQKRYLLRQLFI